MAQEEITLKLRAEEINIILEAAGNMPFVKVYNLIGKIQTQAASQLNNENSPATSDGTDNSHSAAEN